MFTKIVKILTLLLFVIMFNISSIGTDWVKENEKRDEVEQLNESLIEAVGHGDLKGVKDALQRGADINYKGTYFSRNHSFIEGSAIFQAVYHKHLNILKFLIEEKGLDPNVSDNNGQTLFEAAVYNDLKIARYLIQHGLHKNSLKFNYARYSVYDATNVIKFLVWNGIPHFKKDEDLKDIVNNSQEMINPLSQAIKEVDETKKREFEIALLYRTEVTKLLKLALRVESFENKSYKDIVKKINHYRRCMLQRFKEFKIFPEALEKLITDYFSPLLPETPEEFFKISEEERDDLISDYKLIGSEEELKGTKELTQAR